MGTMSTLPNSTVDPFWLSRVIWPDTLELAWMSESTSAGPGMLWLCTRYTLSFP